MKNFKKYLLGIIIVFALFLINQNTVKAYVDDECNALGDEYPYVESRIQSFEKANECNVVLRLYDNYGDIKSQTDSWYNTIADSLKYDRTIIFAINFATRETLIIGYDKYDWVDFNDNSSIVVDTAPYLTSEDYSGCIDVFLEMLPRHITTQKAIKASLIIIINLIIWNLIIFLISRNYGNKDTTTPQTYLTENSRIVGRRDIFLRKTVTKTRKSSSSSGGGGHSHGHGGVGHF